MIEGRSQVTVRYAETDAMGVVYHGSYLPWFEIGRTDMLKQHGLPYRDIEAAGYHLPVTEATMRFLRPARYDDLLTIVSRMKEKPSVRLRIEYEVWRDDTLLATGTTSHAFINLQGQPVRPPPHFLARMTELFG